MKRLLKKVVPFSITFLLGIFIASFYKSTEISINLQQNPNSEIKRTLFNPPKPMECDRRTTLERLMQERDEIKDWLKNNLDAPKEKRKLS